MKIKIMGNFLDGEFDAPFLAKIRSWSRDQDWTIQMCLGVDRTAYAGYTLKGPGIYLYGELGGKGGKENFIEITEDQATPIEGRAKALERFLALEKKDRQAGNGPLICPSCGARFTIGEQQ